MLKRITIGLILLVAIAVFVMTYVTPWPSVLIIRSVFDAGAEKASAALLPKVPRDIMVKQGLAYDPADSEVRLDIYSGRAASPNSPTIVWFHGGGFVSGRRADVANYLKILAGRGFTVVNVDYTIAPEALYPAPIRQSNAALAYLTANAKTLGINPDKFVLAGDSAGAQIAAQTAATITTADYAATVGITPGISSGKLAGVLLHCGVYDVTQIGKGGGFLSWFVRATTWAYSGKRDPSDNPSFASMSISPSVARTLPPAFVSAGNVDPLGPQSVALAATLEDQGVPVTTLFFPKDYEPPLGHEYQFDLNTAAGKMALDHSIIWLLSL